MECENCKYGVLDHYVAGAPVGVYTCGHPQAQEFWDKNDGEGCPLEDKNEHTTPADHIQESKF